MLTNLSKGILCCLALLIDPKNQKIVVDDAEKAEILFEYTSLMITADMASSKPIS